MPELPVGTSKLIQYLNEAYGTERRLEVALQAHIGLASRAAYKKRLRDHLTETKRHGREVSKRIKQLGGAAETIDLPGPDALGEVAQTAVAGAQRAVAFAQGPLHALRGTGAEEKQLKNAKTEYASEAQEIATYSAIISVAEALGDRDTAKLARAILREEERMRSFLEKEIPRMAGAVVTAEVPRSQRAGAAKRRKRPSRAPAKPARRRAPAAGSKRSASARSGSKRATSRSASARSGSQRAKSRSASARSGSKRATSRRSTPRRATSAAR